MMMITIGGVLLMWMGLVFKFCKELRWLEEWVNRDSEAIIEEFRNDSCQQRTANLQTWVRVSFYKEDFEVLVNHEVVTENLKAV